MISIVKLFPTLVCLAVCSALVQADEITEKYKFADTLIAAATKDTACDLSIRHTRQDDSESLFFVYLDAAGEDCHEVIELLNQRGEIPRFAFIAAQESRTPEVIPYLDAPVEPETYDPLNEIDQ